MKGPGKLEDRCFLSRSVIKKHSLSSYYLVPETVIQWDMSRWVQKTWEKHIKNLYKIQYKYRSLPRDPSRGSHTSTLTNGTNRQKQCLQQMCESIETMEKQTQTTSVMCMGLALLAATQGRKRWGRLAVLCRWGEELLELIWWTRHPQDLID